MRRAVTALLLALCFSALSHEGAAARQERAKTPPPPPGETTAAEAVGSLVSLLKDARAHRIPRTQSTQRLSRVRAEGCVLRYNVVTEYESPGFYSPNSYPSDRPQMLTSDFRLLEREFTVNLSDLDASRVRVYFGDRLKKKGGGSVLFRTLGGKESVREQWVQNSRLGARALTRWSKLGGLSLGDDGSLENVAAALRRAVEVCAADAR